MALVMLIFLMIASPPSFATETPHESLVGCFNRLPDGALEFGAVPSGEQFTIRGNTKLAEGHINQLVRVSANLERTEHDRSSRASLTILKVQVLATSCTSVAPSTTLDATPGKVGEDNVAVPRTDTSTEGRTTPGFQTGVAGQPAKTPPSNNPNVEPHAGPPLPEQVGQSEAAANRNANSVNRTEILPSGTLGVSGSKSESEPAANVSHSLPGASAQSGSPSIVVTISGEGVPTLSPPKLSIRTGQTVLWLNSTATMQEILANPAQQTKLSDATIPANAKPFDSAFVGPGRSFQHQFNVPGIYHYFCKVGTSKDSVQVLGEVDVR